MKNFPFEHNGETFWYSRGIVCVSFIFATDKNGDIHVLANKRGSGVPTPGYWNCPCGHLDFDEDCKDCAVRETYEETGIQINKKSLTLYTINDRDFQSKDQSLGFIYYTMITDKTIEEMPTNKKHMEKNEVDEIKWINVDQLNDYKWAFNHEKRIMQILNYLNK
ncbi:MAG: MutT/NUDIX hydrolase [Wendovervirus sonii]|uniref:MutT/NUDIX hydrolase n=1 Tax=phage Lak_Megaphage_Sonny TaxID=3109229 RepID=A0ABZ0Z6N3_9CAUD|nr:MAG: MutT/NUDIX hydrolase [phage Lak_Megaphage_Sonny]